MTKTPRTDEHLRVKEENGHTVIVSREFAEQLETELADARAEIERLKLVSQNQETVIAAQRRSAKAKNELIEQMRSALGRIADELEPSEHDIRGCMFKACKWCDARAALSAAERGE